MKSWFEVDKDGLKELQAGKSKRYILRELVQNAWDENITSCVVTLDYVDRHAGIIIIDDNPEGFKDLTDSFTLFKHTDKRKNPTKRGRFNIGEKQVIACCEWALISTTKGTVKFDKKGRHHSYVKTVSGTVVTLKIKMTKMEYDDLIYSTKLYLPPKGIQFRINSDYIKYKKPYKTFEAKLATEIEEDGVLKKTSRITEVDVHKTDKAILYEMGIPVTEIECQFSIDVQQKIPLSIDRENVSESFLRDLYAEVLNHVHEDITPETASQVWIREATSDDRINKEAVQNVIKQRYGDKVVVANPRDKKSIEEAISRGYKVVYGSEMGKEEWINIKKDELIKSSSDLFGTQYTDFKSFKDITSKHKAFIEYVNRIAIHCLRHKVSVSYIISSANVMADYCKENKSMRVNISMVPTDFFDKTVSEQTTDLILHELAHEFGGHLDKSYHQALTKMCSQLIMKALEDSDFFKIDG